MLKELEEAHEELTENTERVNRAIHALEEELLRIGVGVTVWVDSTIEIDQQKWTIGFTRIGRGWSLAAHRLGDGPIKLSGAPRHVRVRAIYLLDQVVTELIKKVKLQSISAYDAAVHGFVCLREIQKKVSEQEE